MSIRRVALLRGVNVGGHRKVPMVELRGLLSRELELEDLATYIQSGNVVYNASASTMTEDAVAIGDVIGDHFGFDVPVIVRDVEDLVKLLEQSATLFRVADADTHDRFVHIGFFTATPTDASVEAIDLDRSPGDEVIVDGIHAHVSYSAGAGSTKLTGDYLERTLGVGVTMRNLATIRKLTALA